MRFRSASTQKSLPSVLSTTRATGRMRPVVKRTSRSVPSRAARSILAIRSCMLVKYRYLWQERGRGGTGAISCQDAARTAPASRLPVMWVRSPSHPGFSRWDPPSLSTCPRCLPPVREPAGPQGRTRGLPGEKQLSGGDAVPGTASLGGSELPVAEHRRASNQPPPAMLWKGFSYRV